jgi:hypothetical protein
LTPEQAAAFVNAQAAFFLGELELLKARYTSIAFTPDGHFQSVVCNVDPAEMQALLDRYVGTLGHNSVLQLFQDVAR